MDGTVWTLTRYSNIVCGEFNIEQVYNLELVDDNVSRIEYVH